jgi:hypothetical protein
MAQYSDPVSLATTRTPFSYVATYDLKNGKWDLVTLTSQ